MGRGIRGLFRGGAITRAALRPLRSTRSHLAIPNNGPRRRAAGIAGITRFAPCRAIAVGLLCSAGTGHRHLHSGFPDSVGSRRHSEYRLGPLSTGRGPSQSPHSPPRWASSIWHLTTPPWPPCVRCARCDEPLHRSSFFRHPPASRACAAQTGGPSGARERDPGTGASASTLSPSAPLGPPVPLRGPEDDER